MKKLLLFVFLSFFLFACGNEELDSQRRLQWNNHPLNVNFNIQGIACGDNGSVIAVGRNGLIATSVNGASWGAPSRITPVNSGTNSREITADLNAIAFCNGRFMVAGNDHTVLFSSDNGSRWSMTSPDSFFDINYFSIACTGSTILVGGRTTLSPGDARFDNRTAITTNGGTDWTTQTVSTVISDNDSLVGVNHLAHSGSQFWLATDGGRMGYSAGGILWNVPRAVAIDASFNFTSMAFGKIDNRTMGMMSAVSVRDNVSGRVIFNSDNISNWYQSGLPVDGPVRGVAYGRDMFIALTDNASFRTDNVSEDNTSLTWETDNFPQTGNGTITVVTHCGGNFFVGTDRGQIFRAPYR